MVERHVEGVRRWRFNSVPAHQIVDSRTLTACDCAPMTFHAPKTKKLSTDILFDGSVAQMNRAVAF